MNKENSMSIHELVRGNRSRRRFYQEISTVISTLQDLVDLARLSASGANRQPLKYIISNDPKVNATIFQHLKWAAYLQDWDGPTEGEKPSAYIIILGDTSINPSFGIDPGIAAQSILLGATEKELGGCIIASIDKDGLRNDLEIPTHLEILFVIALGKPKETVVIESLAQDGDIRYWRDESGVHHVPKRSLDELIIKTYDSTL